MYVARTILVRQLPDQSVIGQRTGVAATLSVTTVASVVVCISNKCPVPTVCTLPQKQYCTLHSSCPAAATVGVGAPQVARSNHPPNSPVPQMHALLFHSSNVILVHLGHCLLTSWVAALLSASVALASALALWGKVVDVTDALAVLATVAVLHNLAGWLAG